MAATNGVVLLTGNFVNNSIAIPLSDTSTAYQSGTVIYTGGIILDAILASDLSKTAIIGISMTPFVPIGINYDTALANDPLLETSATVDAFDADATGVFSTDIVTPVPEPAFVSFALLVTGSLLARRQRQAFSAVLK
jgi:hypothetical protein